MNPEVTTPVVEGLVATNALYTNLAGILITVVLLLVGWFVVYKVRNSKTIKEKLNEFGYDEKQFETLVLGAITFAEQAAKAFADKTISKNTHSLSFLKNVDPELIDKYGEKVGKIVIEKAKSLGKIGWTDSDGDGVLDTPPAEEAKVVEKTEEVKKEAK